MTDELKKALEEAKTVEEKKAVEAENKVLKALSEEELEEVAGGTSWLEEMDTPDESIGGGNEGGAKGGAIYNANYNPRTVKTK